MKLSRLALPAFILALTVPLANCGDSSPVAPSPVTAAPAQDGSLLGNDLASVFNIINPLLMQCTQQPQIVVSKTIGPAGGTMQIGNHTFTVPAGALSSNKTITATQVAGNYAHIDFKPEGLQFATSATLTMSYANCAGVFSLLPHHIAYVSDDMHTIFYFLLGIDDLLNKKVSGKVDHFSDYMIAW